MAQLRVTLLACLFTGCVLSALGGEGGFSATLSSTQQAAAGLTALTTAERTALDELVAQELGAARQRDADAVTGSFSQRRTSAERQAAGLDRLSPTEQAELDALVARALGARPKPKERPRLKDNEIVFGAPKPEIHGSVSFTYGWGSGGRDFRSSSLWVSYTDPNRRYSLGVGLSTSRGDLFPGYYHGYDRHGFYRPWGSLADEFWPEADPFPTVYPPYGFGPWRDCQRW